MLYIKIRVGEQIWLVPEHELSPLFRSAVELINKAELGARVKLSEEQADEIFRIADLENTMSV